MSQIIFGLLYLTWQGVRNANRPLHDYVIVDRKKIEEHLSTGGIVMADTANEKPAQGKVVAVGNGVILESGKVMPLDLKTGDQILFSKYAGTEI